MGEGFSRQTRRVFAGMLGTFQENATRYGGKRPGHTVFEVVNTGSYDSTAAGGGQAGASRFGKVLPGYYFGKPGFMKGAILMNAGFIVCGGACFLFLLLTFIFTIFKEKSAMLISGFNTMPKEKRALYDKEKFSKDQRNRFLVWAVIQGIGAVLAYYISPYMAVIAFIIWFIVFFRDVHLDKEKAFGKYKK